MGCEQEVCYPIYEKGDILARLEAIGKHLQSLEQTLREQIFVEITNAKQSLIDRLEGFDSKLYEKLNKIHLDILTKR